VPNVVYIAYGCTSWWWTQIRPKHVEVDEIRISCASSWFFFTRMLSSLVKFIKISLDVMLRAYIYIYIYIHIFAYLLTPWSRVLLENLTSFQLVKKFPTFYGTRRFITAFISARHLSLPWASLIHSIIPHSAFWRFILILSSLFFYGRTVHFDLFSLLLLQPMHNNFALKL